MHRAPRASRERAARRAGGFSALRAAEPWLRRRALLRSGRGDGATGAAPPAASGAMEEAGTAGAGSVLIWVSIQSGRLETFCVS